MDENEADMSDLVHDSALVLNIVRALLVQAHLPGVCVLLCVCFG